jgi:hypothetical protein
VREPNRESGGYNFKPRLELLNNLTMWFHRLITEEDKMIYFCDETAMMERSVIGITLSDSSVVAVKNKHFRTFGIRWWSHVRNGVKGT